MLMDFLNLQNESLWRGIFFFPFSLTLQCFPGHQSSPVKTGKSVMYILYTSHCHRSNITSSEKPSLTVLVEAAFPPLCCRSLLFSSQYLTKFGVMLIVYSVLACCCFPLGCKIQGDRCFISGITIFYSG